MNRIYCSNEDRALHDIAKDIVMSRNVWLVVPSSKYISYAVSVLRNAFDTIMKAKIVDVHETQNSAVIEAEITGCFGTDKLSASVYTMDMLPSRENDTYCGVYFFNESKCLNQYITNKGYTRICSVVDIFAEDPIK